jgi:hypothetical protein
MVVDIPSVGGHPEDRMRPTVHSRVQFEDTGVCGLRVVVPERAAASRLVSHGLQGLGWSAHSSCLRAGVREEDDRVRPSEGRGRRDG